MQLCFKQFIFICFKQGQYVGVYKPRKSSEFMVFILIVHV